MKRIIKLLIVGLIIGISNIFVFAQTPVNKIVEVKFSGSSNYVWSTSAGYPMLTSVIMSFISTTNNNKFTLNLIRNNVIHSLLDIENDNMHTLTWYLANDLYMKPGDVLTWRNTNTNAAIIIFSVKYVY